MHGIYVTRSGHVSFPPTRLIKTAYAVMNETSVQTFKRLAVMKPWVLYFCIKDTNLSKGIER
jgi:hypothetical protein